MEGVGVGGGGGFRVNVNEELKYFPLAPFARSIGSLMRF